MKTPEQLKGTIRSMAEKKNLRAQEVLQMFLFERIIDRLAGSAYRENFILKGGLLISSMIGISERTTMDMDTTVRGIQMDEAEITEVVKKILSIDVGDGISFEFQKIEPIREEDEYHNFRVHLHAQYGKINSPMKIDITTGDVVTPSAVQYDFPLLFEDRSVSVMAYTLETVLAEKYETILRRNIGTTRARDFYDLHMLYLGRKNTIRMEIFRKAVLHTAEKRGSLEDILVKDLSRFGRDYIECGKYIEKIFPQLGIRFIALNDGFDTQSSSSTDSIVIPFKNLINDSYSRDISIKVRSNLEVKRRQGEFISNFAVYGYKKDKENKNHLVVDEYAASIVQDIFKWAIEGHSPGSIALRLNQLGVLSPMEYKKSQGSKYKSKFKTGAQAKWSHVAVRRILQNEIYTGTMVQGRRTTPNHKTKKFIYKDQNDWVRVEGTHEAIISRPQFDLVQQILQEDTRANAENAAVHPYCGRIFCGDCGAPIVRKTTVSDGKRYVYYVCGANKADSHTCSKHSIREEILDDAVLVTIQRQIEIALDMDAALRQIETLSWERTELRKIEANIEVQNQIIQKNNNLRLGIYEDLQSGILSREEFMTLKEEFSSRIAAAKKVIDQLISSKSEIQHGLSKQQSWLAQFREYENITAITRRLIVSLVERINVYEDSEIEVVFRHRDQFAHIKEFLENQEGKSEKIQIFPQLEVV